VAETRANTKTYTFVEEKCAIDKQKSLQPQTTQTYATNSAWVPIDTGKRFSGEWVVVLVGQLSIIHGVQAH
jgi:hypothetical protein